MILQCMEKIIKEKLDSIDKGLAESIVKQAAHELTQSKVNRYSFIVVVFRQMQQGLSGDHRKQL